MKNCEICTTPIPEDYVNLLCDSHYRELETENARLMALVNEERESLNQSQNALETPQISPNSGIVEPNQGILDPEYKTNPQAEDKEQWEANFEIFRRNGVFLWKPTRLMYEFIKTYSLNKVVQHPQYPKFIWKPKIVDVGCGTGCGSNILSQEADFVWGIDKNKKSIEFAKQCFERIKNGIYYSSQVSFDNIDIFTDNRDYMKFDIVVAIEVIEHIEDAEGFLKILISKFDKQKPNDPTEYFISTPNRNNKSIRKDKPYNPYHVREWTSEEFYELLSKYFKVVKLHNAKGEPTERTTEHTPLLALCSQAIL